MLRKRTKKDYLVPRAVVTEVDLEGLICNSVRFNIQVKELDNMNHASEDETSSEVFYFES